MTSSSNARLCLQHIGFARKHLNSRGTDEVRPYAEWGNLRRYSLRGESWRLARFYQSNSANTAVPPYRFIQELNVLGSIEQPVSLEDGSPVVVDVEVLRSVATGRGLICSCYGKRYVNATVRKSAKEGLGDFSLNFEVYIDPKNPVPKPIDSCKYKFAPTNEYDFFYHSIKDTCDALFEIIGDFKGVVVVAGGTGSGKSQIVRGLIHHFITNQLMTENKLEVDNAAKFLARVEKYTKEEIEPARAKLEAGKMSDSDFQKIIAKTPIRSLNKRVHLLTVENPIEKFLFEAEDSSPLSPNRLAETIGLDYTPRQIPEDTPSLEQALMRDALRQTPTLTYVGEVREPHEFRTVLDFAETGQCVITTMHAGSLREAFQRLLSAAGADTPGSRAQIASRIGAVVHLQPLLDFEMDCTLPVKEKQEGRKLKLSLPAVWKNTPTAVSNLVADGLSSLIPNASLSPDPFCFGRTHFLIPHTNDAKPKVTNQAQWEEARQKVVALDMGRGDIPSKIDDELQMDPQITLDSIVDSGMQEVRQIALNFQ